MFLIELILAQFLGLVGHWATRWVQQRTGSTFIAYMKDQWAYSVASGSAGLASAFTIYTATPEDIAGKALLLILIGAYMSGYTIDSKVNRETSPEPAPAAKKEVQRDQIDVNKSLNDLLADES